MSRRRAIAAALALATLAAPAAARAQPVQMSAFGAWCWFGDPRAIYHDGRTYAGWVDRDGYVVVGMRDGSHVVRRRLARMSEPGARDDHDSPALLVEPRGRITAFFSHHNGPAMYWRRTTKPWDVSEWGPRHTQPNNTRTQNTYPNPVRLADESTTYLFWRGDAQPTFARQRDKWSKARTLIAEPGDNPYVKVASNDRDTIGFAFTNGHPREAVTNVYYARYRGGAIEHADGRRIATLGSAPFRPSQADLVYSAAGHDGRHAWVHDVALTASGRPVIVYATFSADGYAHRYEYARWTGSHWATHPIAEAGGPITTATVERWYSGGVALDHGDPSTVHASVQEGGHHEIVRFTTADGGKTWQRTAVTSGSSTDNVRPVVPRGQPQGVHQVLWMRGLYDRYQDFRTAIVAGP